jgi:hypothetical protein
VESNFVVTRINRYDVKDAPVLILLLLLLLFLFLFLLLLLFFRFLRFLLLLLFLLLFVFLFVLFVFCYDTSSLPHCTPSYTSHLLHHTFTRLTRSFAKSNNRNTLQ